MRTWTTHRVMATFAVVAVLLGCKNSKAPREETLVVFAASSLKEVMGDLQSAYELHSVSNAREEPSRHHSSPPIVVHFAGSGELVTQLEHGADADILATADEVTFRRAETRGLTDHGRIFAENALAVVSPKSGAAIPFQKLPAAGRIVLGATEVPVGKYADAALSKANSLYGSEFSKRTMEKVVSREANTRFVVNKVLLGEADAAIVYLTDALAFREQLHFEPLPKQVQERVRYPIGTLKSAHLAPTAREFISFVLSAEGQKILQDRGFLAPGASE